MTRLSLPMTAQQIRSLSAGDSVLLSGIVYTARDAAHKRIEELIISNQPLPFDLKGAAIYYTGPCPAKPGRVLGSCGPTTSGRMNAYAPLLFDLGVQCTIGKGPLGQEVTEAIVRNQAVYFCAVGGAGALLSRCVRSAQVMAFADLGAEAVILLKVADFPVIVGVDSRGGCSVR